MVINPILYHFLDVMSFYARNKEKLLVKCTDNRIYSHCQEYYLLQVHTDADMCSSYAPTPCSVFRLNSQLDIHNADFTGVTLVNQLSSFYDCCLSK